MAPPRLRDVAERAGVSVTTASIVLRRQPGIRVADATKERVFAAAEELGYLPRAASRAARLIALVGAAAGHPIVPHLVASAAERGCLLLVLPDQHRAAADAVRLPELAGAVVLASGWSGGSLPAEVPPERTVGVDLSGAAGGRVPASPLQERCGTVVVPDEADGAARAADVLRGRLAEPVAVVAGGAALRLARRWQGALERRLGRRPQLWVADGASLRPVHGPVGEPVGGLVCVGPDALTLARRAAHAGPDLVRADAVVIARVAADPPRTAHGATALEVRVCLGHAARVAVDAVLSPGPVDGRPRVVPFTLEARETHEIHEEAEAHEAPEVHKEPEVHEEPVLAHR